MKTSEFRKLIREEICKVLKEVTVKVPSDGIVRDHTGKAQLKFTPKGSGTEVKSLSTGETILSPYPIDKAYNALFSVGQIDANDGNSFNGKMQKTFNDDIEGEDISAWTRFLMPKANLQIGAKGVDTNDFPLTITAGPFDSVKAIEAAIKTKFSKAMDIFRNKDLVAELNKTKASDVGGFYLVKGPEYGGSGYTVVNGEDILIGRR